MSTKKVREKSTAGIDLDKGVNNDKKVQELIESTTSEYIDPKTAKKGVNSNKKSNLSLYNRHQKLLSSYLHDKQIHLGKDYFRVSKELYSHIKSQGYDLKYLSMNYDALYQFLFGSKEIVTNDYPNTFPFYQLGRMMQDSIYDGVSVGFEWGDLSYNGSSDGFDTWFYDNLKSYCRFYWSDSPDIAMLDVFDSGLDFVVYTLNIPYDASLVKEFLGTGFPTAPLPEIKKPNIKVKDSVVIDYDKEIELIKARTAENESKIKLYSIYKELELSNEEIKELLGL